MPVSAEESAAPVYPPAPWTLSGVSVQALRLVEIASVRSLVPPELRIVPLLPGKTLSVLYCASYEPPSTLCYHELIVAPALTYARGSVGFWISHIYVDHPASQAAGREIWGLPKELARFEWAPQERRAAVTTRERSLCSLEWETGSASVPAPLLLPVISQRGSHLQYFNARGVGTVGVRGARITMDPGGPFAALGFGHTRRVAVASRLNLKIGAPRPVG
jgi:hypothetical protein